jgi:hypothetical protein
VIFVCSFVSNVGGSFRALHPERKVSTVPGNS